MTTRDPYLDLPSFVEALQRAGELVEVAVPVDANLEIAEVHRRVIAAEGPALLFRRVQGSPYPVVTNLYGSPQRLELAFGSDPFRLVERLAQAAPDLLPPSPGRLWRQKGLLGALLRAGPRSVRSAPVTQVVERPPDLETLPFLTLWPDDGGPFNTLGLVYTQHPDRPRESNLGIYRMQRFDGQHTGMHWQIGKGGGFHYHLAEERGTPLPVTVFLGGPPAATLAAAAPLPEGVPELVLAGMLLGARLEVKSQRDLPHRLLARAEFALVGEVAPGERRPEGPFGDHYGYYSLTHDYPVFRCHTLLRRREPIYPATVVGRPRQEDYHIGNFLQTLLAPLFPLVMPSVRALWSYGDAGFHPLAACTVAERYGREAMMSAFRVLGEGQLSLTKMLLVTDAPLDLRDFRALLEHVLARADPSQDLYVLPHLSMDTLDYAGPEVNRGSKAVLLGLGEARRTLPEEFSGPLPPGVREAVVFAPGALVLTGEPHARDREQPARIAGHPSLAPWPLVVLCDDARAAAASTRSFLWTTFTRFDPAADLHSRSPLVLDARMKAWYPALVESDPEVRERVTRRWAEYFPDPASRPADGSGAA